MGAVAGDRTHLVSEAIAGMLDVIPDVVGSKKPHAHVLKRLSGSWVENGLWGNQ